MRVRKKGRAKGGIITAINKELREIEYKEISDNIVERKIVYNDKTYRVMVVYNQDTKGTWKEIQERVDGRGEEVMIIGGDWNARMGEGARPIIEDLQKGKSNQKRMERKKKRDEKENDKVYERKMQQRSVHWGKKGIQTVVQTKKGKTRRGKNGENKEDQNRTKSVEIHK